ncbi:MAG: hypothetical protein U0T85_02995 [Cloacibacterium normanense]
MEVIVDISTVTFMIDTEPSFRMEKVLLEKNFLNYNTFALEKQDAGIRRKRWCIM